MRDLRYNGEKQGERLSEKRVAKRRLSASIDRGVTLTPRDFEIFEFILEMKFASREEVYRKFFRTTRNECEARSDAWAKKRLMQLERGGFLRSTYAFSESTRYFVGTLKAYYALSSIVTNRPMAKPTGGFDQRTFIHDKTILQIRLELEESGVATEWTSDRVLRSGHQNNFGLTAAYVPDAIYKVSSGERVAFELEIAQKSRARYQDKIRRYVELMRTRKLDTQMFRRVHFVCLRKAPFEALKSETRIYGELFRVDLREADSCGDRSQR